MKKNGSDETVCRAFVIDVYKVSAKRVRVVQMKILQNSLFEEKRGGHGKQKKVENSVWQMAMEHLRGIPHCGSHYTFHTNWLYFDNPDLMNKGLYGMFQEYYEEHNGKPLTMAYKTYFKFYRKTNYAVRRPKTDVCYFCTECEKILENYPNHPCLHKKKAER
ncbi:hypothetical protein PR048_019561 [Dryococelus australis]|uniref:Uncharacterized protein n=1 Tax=Dryococelus australis TaxID=614101 RepID=A0ABQ9H3T5_9NEOP|nr:hypothetical protein PR048_019561 [Dryococelus australis]